MRINKYLTSNYYYNRKEKEKRKTRNERTWRKREEAYDVFVRKRFYVYIAILYTLNSTQNIMIYLWFGQMHGNSAYFSAHIYCLHMHNARRNLSGSKRHLARLSRRIRALSGCCYQEVTVTEIS